MIIQKEKTSPKYSPSAITGDENKFYDIHFHAMDLSHANITAFLHRLMDQENGIFSAKSIQEIIKNELPRWKLILISLASPLVMPFISYNLLANKIHEKIISIIKDEKLKEKTDRIRNLLSFMENSIEFDFLVVEYFLKRDLFFKNDELKMGNHLFNKMVLCPLIMDFGYKDINNPAIFYNIPPQKPVTEQITDLFKAIRTYYSCELNLKTESQKTTFTIKKSTIPPYKKFFEILPFMGLNTINYEYDKIEKMLNKYFSDFSPRDTPAQRSRKLLDKMGKFCGDLENEQDCKNIFAGIKLYPPLGFDPLPEKCPSCDTIKNCKCERAKVLFLFRFCSERKIPITTHCSTGGFITDKNAHSFTDPSGKWLQVLNIYPELKLNFAHFGSGNPLWMDRIKEHLLNYENVYTDFSCNTENQEYYSKLLKIMQEHPQLEDKVLFGSDFMINLLWMNSYNEYLDCFLKSEPDQDIKLKLVQKNPERFLFG